jgi:hypothetical protein
VSQAKSDIKPKAQQSTTFNDIEVPPMTELTPSNWDETTSTVKHLLVKHYR